MNKYWAVTAAIKYLAGAGVKTADYMNRTVDSLVRDLYKNEISDSEFQDSMFQLIEDQFKRAFNEGMRINDLDPAVDWNDEIESAYQEAVTNQIQYIEKFAMDIENGASSESGTSEFLSRSELWANQYDSVVQEAQMLTAEKKDKYIWELGATEHHCESCSALNGIVAYAEEWQEAGFIPGNAPNNLLICGGWHCDCKLKPTDERRTQNALQILLDLATSQNV